ncbi:hypothetical protein [Chamaesiphon sp.]|uniref:hypothetical protein n=1 Tax=Chamaesiphon sp. TaxID=2814140 RepID=UPI00359352ED
MSNITLTIASDRLDFAIGLMQGAALANPKLTDNAIGKRLEFYGYTPIEIMLAKQFSPERLEAIQNPVVKEAKKRGRKAKAVIVQSDITMTEYETVESYDSQDDGLGV